MRAKFQARGIVTGVTYSRNIVPVDARLYAFLLAQAREELRRLHPNASLDEQRLRFVGLHADVLEAARFDDRASAAARRASSGAAAFEALRQRDADLVGRARENPGAAHLSTFNAQCRALKERFAAAGYPDLGWATNATPEDTSFLQFMAAKVRQAARERLGDDVSALRAAFAKIRTIFWEAADFELASADAFDAAAFDALAAADADVVDRARVKPSGRGRGGGRVAEFPKKLAELVRQHAGVAFWDAPARELVIVNKARFESDVMLCYFSSAAYSGFQRQLNNYGFSIAESAALRADPEGALVYSNCDTSIRSVADFARLVNNRGRAKPKPAPAPAPKRPGTARQAAMRAHTDAALAALTQTELRRIMAARGVGPPDEPPATPAPVPAAAPALQSLAPQVQLDDADDAAPWSGPAPELGGEEAPPQGAPVAPPSAPQPVAAVAALPFGMGAAADARVPFGGALPTLGVDVELDAALAAPALAEALAASTWETPPPPEPDAGALALVLEALDEESRQAAAAPAPVVAAPALVSPVAAAASTKRPRDESPKSVAQSCVESYQ